MNYIHTYMERKPIPYYEIHLFTEMVPYQGLSQAAQHLGLGQSALSHALKRLEDYLGQKLFLRTKKGMTLTRQGEEFYQKARVLVRRMGELREELYSESQKLQGRYTCGIHESVSLYLAPKLLSHLLQSHPIDIQFVHKQSRELGPLVADHSADFAFAIDPIDHPDIVKKVLVKEISTLWVHKSVKRKNLPLFYSPAYRQYQQLEKKIPFHQFSQTITTSSYELIKNCVLEKAGVGLFPARILQPKELQKVRPFLPNGPFFNQTLYLIYHYQFTRIASHRALIDELAAQSLSILPPLDIHASTQS